MLLQSVPVLGEVDTNLVSHYYSGRKCAEELNTNIGLRDLWMILELVSCGSTAAPEEMGISELVPASNH